MSLRSAAVVALAVLTGLVAAGADAGRFKLQGTVTRVLDGDTVVVTVGGKSERVRLIGVDTPEAGRCYAREAKAATRRLADGKRVVLAGDPTQDTRDRYGRLLAYVWLPGGKDLGLQLVAGGFAEAYVYERPFRRLAAYRGAEAKAKRLAKSVWSCSAPKPETPPANDCDPSYPDVCIPPYAKVGDLDCADVPYTNIRVLPPDPHGFDGRDNDGWGCEG